MKLVLMCEKAEMTPSNKHSVEVSMEGVYVDSLVNGLPDIVDLDDIFKAYGMGTVLNALNRDEVLTHFGIQPGEE
jgi:hypothetical protein